MSEEEEVLDEDDLEREAARMEMPPASDLLMLQDFEDWAERVLTNTAWSYYRSAADEERGMSNRFSFASRYLVSLFYFLDLLLIFDCT